MGVDWSGYIQTGIGIVVSVILFLLGYRQTIGADKERARAASEAVYRAILKRVALEDYQPRLIDITRLVEGKAQQFQVKPKSLVTPEQLMSRLYADIYDNELIGPSVRGEIQKRVETALDELAKRDLGRETVFALSRNIIEGGSLLLPLLVVGAALVGTLASNSTGIIQGENFPANWQVFLAALGAVTAVLVLRLRVDSVSLTLVDVFEVVLGPWVKRKNLSSLVIKTLEDMNLPYQLRGVGWDITTESGGTTLGLVLKDWQGSVELADISKLLYHIQQMSRMFAVERTIVVVRRPIRQLPTVALKEANVDICTIDQLRTYLGEYSAA